MDGANAPERRALEEQRDRTLAVLADAFAHDELGLETFDARVADAYAAENARDLEALVADVTRPASETAMTAVARPRSPAAQVVVVRTEPSPRPRLLGILSSVERRGTWVVPSEASVVAVLGSVELDVREAELGPGTTTLHVRAVLGNVEITVPADVRVECVGSGFLGSFDADVRTPRWLPEDAPRLRIEGSAVLGSITVRARPPARLEAVVKELRGAR